VGTFDDSSVTSLASDPKLDDVEASNILHESGDTRPDSTGGIENVPSTNPLSSLRPPRFRASIATMTGLKRKEMIRLRRRQVLGIIEGLPQSDPLALENALAAPLSWYCSPPKSRSRVLPSSTRNRSRQRTILPPITLSEADFTFQCHSPATDRTALTRIQVEDLKNRFEKELLRQANAAAEAAKNATTKAVTTNEGNGKVLKWRAPHHQKKAHPRAGEQHGVRSPPEAAKTVPNSETGGVITCPRGSLILDLQPLP